MKKIAIVLLSICTLTSCAQKQKVKPSNIKIRNSNINKDNVVAETLKSINHYDKEPMYFIRPIQNNCTYEILVNDFPVYDDFESLEILATPVEINGAILKSGEQTITVRMYPVGDLLKDNYDIGETITTLLDNTSMKVEVVKYDAYNISHKLSDEKTVLKHYSPTKGSTKKFIGAGLPYYEYTFSFNAEVPYENEGWLNGEDLTKFEKKKLESEVVEAYNDFKSIHSNNDIDNFTRLEYDYILRSCVAYYRNKKYIKNLWNEHVEPLSFKNKEYQKIENYEMKFYGNNRIVCLKFPNNENIDSRLRRESAFWFKYNNGDGIRGWFSNIYLYIPKGGTLDDLQTIK